MTKKKKQPPKLICPERYHPSAKYNPELDRSEKFERLIYEGEDGKPMLHPEIAFMLRDINRYIQREGDGDHEWAAHCIMDLERMLNNLYKLPHSLYGFRKPINPKKER